MVFLYGHLSACKVIPVTLKHCQKRKNGIYLWLQGGLQGKSEFCLEGGGDSGRVVQAVMKGICHFKTAKPDGELDPFGGSSVTYMFFLFLLHTHLWRCTSNPLHSFAPHGPPARAQPCFAGGARPPVLAE